MNGSYTCSCAKGKGDGRTSCTEDSLLKPLLIGIFSSLLGGPVISGAIFWLVQKRKQVLLRRKYFLQNRGLLLHEYISSDRGRRKATIFSEAELVKATNNFSEDLQVGVGGFGNVYQGKLEEGRLGTLGYVDPHYYKTLQLTDKTDIYSFAVVMVELLTSMKPMSVGRAKEERILADLFLSRKSQGLLAELFDTRLLIKDHMESMTMVANLAEACLNEDVNKRPSMKEVVQELLLISGGKMRVTGGAHASVSQKDLKVMNEEERSGPVVLQGRSHQLKKTMTFNIKSRVSHSSPPSIISSIF
ncbi:hypothetical protein SUGI_0242180 [Cryptomeria japonica]|nr:hypothetical protein SUGI_0242180 [Cryptomeria japonica]